MAAKALFLDRDGVLNRERGEYTWRASDFVLNAGIPETLQQFARQGYLLIVITNQGGIAKGLYTARHVWARYRDMQKQLTPVGAALTDMFFCPHHPVQSQCLCRKPAPLMLQRAMARYQITPELSYMIGDSLRDTQAAAAAGVQGIQIQPNENLQQNPYIQQLLQTSNS